MTKTNEAIRAMQNTFGSAFGPVISDLSDAMAKVARMCAYTYDELARGERFGATLPDGELDKFVRSWKADAGKYDGQTKRVAMHYEVGILGSRGWTETVVDGHFAMRSPNGRFIVRYIAVGKTQARSYFERAIQ